jgi:hypothetical protein
MKRNGTSGIERMCFDEDGFSTVGVVIALLITLSLIFTGAQVYRVNALGSSIQETADAAALAAENVVAEYYIAVRVCDAVVLSMNLTGALVMGAGIAALCVPASSAVGAKLIDQAVRILKARDTFARRASSGLNRIQRTLPFLAAASAASVASENSAHDGGASYIGCALLLPTKGEDITAGGIGAADDVIADIRENKDRIIEEGRKADEAAEEANEAKRCGFQFDCGNDPGYCLYERAKKLANLPADKNPRYETVDAWSFAVALRRAQAYYPARLAAEQPRGTSVAAQADSELRKRFYQYAVQQMRTGYVHETTDSFSARFPLLPRNTEEMKRTRLYVEAVYPVTEKKGKKRMHAFAGCPEAADASGMGSVRDLDQGDYECCDECKFTVSSMGKVAAASSNIDNGFEFHYRKVAQAANEYQKAREKQQPATRKVKDLTGSAFQQLKDLMKRSASMRIKANPPGRYGAVALVASTRAQRPDEGFESSFVHTGSTLGTRAAMSAAVLASDEPQQTASVISSLLDGCRGQGQSLGVAGSGAVLDAWSAALSSYVDGQQAIERGIEDLIGALPLVGPSGLGQWASDKFSTMVADVGLEPAKLDAPKPILSNSVHPLEQDGGTVSVRFLSLKRASSWMTQTDVFASGVSAAELSALQKVEDSDGSITVATIEPFGLGGPSYPLTLALPSGARDMTATGIAGIAARLREVAASVTGVKQWK